MRPTALLGAALLLLSLAGCRDTEKTPVAPAPELSPQLPLASLLPTGLIEVEQLAIRYSDRVDELGHKMQEAVATNQAWLLDYVKRAPEGQPLPYHVNLGLSEAEYAEYVQASESGQLTGVRRSPLTFKKDGELVTVSTGSAEAPIAQIKLNARTGFLQASLGDIGLPTWRRSDQENTPIGAYEGYSWHREDGNPNLGNAALVSLDIWQIKKTGKVFWRFTDTAWVRGTLARQYEVMFQYELK